MRKVLPYGLRHYLPLNNTYKLFLNGLLILNFLYYSGINYTLDYKVETIRRLCLGFGSKYNNKLIIELRAYSARKFLGNLTNIHTPYN